MCTKMAVPLHTSSRFRVFSTAVASVVGVSRVRLPLGQQKGSAQCRCTVSVQRPASCAVVDCLMHASSAYTAPVVSRSQALRISICWLADALKRVVATFKNAASMKRSGPTTGFGRPAP